MSAGSMATGFSLPGSFQELIGNFKSAIKEINKELKETREQAKKTFRETGKRDLSAESKIRSLSGDKERLMKLKQSKDSTVNAARIKERAARDIARIGRGGVTTSDLEALTTLVSKRLLSIGPVGGAAQMAGAALGQAPDAIASLAGSVAPVAILATAGGVIAKKVIAFFERDARRRINNSQGDIQFQTELHREFAGTGLSGRISSAEMISIQKAASSEGRKYARAITDATISERLITGFGFAQSEQANAAETAAQFREKKRLLLSKIHPSAATKATRAGVRSNYGGQMEQRLRDEHTGLWLASKFSYISKYGMFIPGMQPLSMAGLVLGEFTNGHLEAAKQAQEEKFMDQALASPEKSKQGQIAFYLTSPTKALNRAFAHETRRHIRAIEVDRRNRFNDWSPF